LGGEKYIIGGENISYKTFFSTIKEKAGKQIFLFHVPKILLKAWAFIYQWYCRLTGKDTHVSPKVVDRLSQNRALSCEKAIRQLGYSITPFAEGINKTILHLQNKIYA
jgi:dihydroflavonol-4-reductase/farnesol dehydrogenase